MPEFSHSGSNKDQYVRDMFNDIAPRYDFLNRVLSLGIDQHWRNRLVGKLELNQDSHVLDVATGTGDVAITILKKHNAQVTGLDVAYNMLLIAGKKTKQKKLSGFQAVLGDAQILPFQDDSFDAITISFGFRNIGCYDSALKEFYRVLKPGGRLAILEFSVPQSKFFNSIYQFYFKLILPRIGAAFARSDAYRYLPESVSHFPSRREINQMFLAAGFSHFSYEDLTFGISSIFLGIK